MADAPTGDDLYYAKPNTTKAGDGLEVVPIPFFDTGAVTLLQRWRLFFNIPRSMCRRMLATVPTAPGRYLDRGGNDWTLDTRGRWHDRHGVSAHPRNNWLLGQFTLTRIPDNSSATDPADIS